MGERRRWGSGFIALTLFAGAINETLSALMTTTTFLDHVIAALAHLSLSHALMDEFGYVHNLYIILILKRAPPLLPLLLLLLSQPN